MNKTKKYNTEFCILFILSLFVFNLIQSYPDLHRPFSWRSIVYLSFHFILIMVLIVCILKSFTKRGVLYEAYRFFVKINIPKGMKLAFLIVSFGNILAIGVGASSYPFSDVGMFRWATDFKNIDKIVYKPKYYHIKDGKVKIIELRKEGFYFLSEYFGLRYTHEFTFAANYHNKGQKENFRYLKEKLRSLGIDTLWVGIQHVNYETRDVWFNTDKCYANYINSNEKIHYGAIYIPEYQLKLCND